MKGYKARVAVVGTGLVFYLRQEKDFPLYLL